jgi:hypothetical protein
MWGTQVCGQDGSVDNRLRSVEKTPKKGPLNRRFLGYARDDKGESDASMESGC